MRGMRFKASIHWSSRIYSSIRFGPHGDRGQRVPFACQNDEEPVGIRRHPEAKETSFHLGAGGGRHSRNVFANRSSDWLDHRT